MTPATRTEWACGIALAFIAAATLGSAGRALDQSLSQSQAADLAAAQQRQALAEERAYARAEARLRRQLAQACGNGLPIIQAREPGAPASRIDCAVRTPRGR